MININGKEYRNIQEQVEKNQEDIETLQESVEDVYTKDESDAKYQDKLTAGTNITIDSDNEISVNAYPIFSNVTIDNGSYYSNTFQGTVIQYNESEDNDEGHIIMSGNNPELYAYNDHLHGEYGNESKLQMLEDIKVSKEGYSNYPDGRYTKSYDLIDTLEDLINRVTALEQALQNNNQ